MSLLTREYTWLREHLPGGVLLLSTVVLSRCEFLALTWVRALPPLCQTPVRHDDHVNLCGEQGEMGSPRQ